MSKVKGYTVPFLLVVAVLGIWELVARTVFAGSFLVPPPESVVWEIWQDRGIYQASVPTTVHEAAIGFVLGNVFAILCALLFLLVPLAEKLFMRLAIVSYCLPTVAIAPILQILLNGESPKIALAAISVFFTTLIIVLTGLRSADPVSLELIKVYGGGSTKALRKVRIPTLMPHLFRALQLAAPTALLGAILGEFLGGSQGIGIAMIVAQAELHTKEMWGLIVVSSVIAAVCYLVIGLIGRRLTRWSVEGGATGAAASMGTIPASWTSGPADASRLRQLLGRSASWVLSIAFILVVWEGSLKVFGLSNYVAKGPLDVWDYLFSGPMASQNRDPIVAALWQTLRDAGFGLLAGVVIGCALAFVVVLVPRVESYVLSWGITLRVLPIAAIAPLIGAVFGRGIIAAIVVCAMISFFPTFVLMVGGLNSATPGSLALIRAYGGNRWKTVRKVQIPSSLSALFAALKIAGPGALVGALVTEWTVTGTGLGAQVIIATNESGFGLIWSAIVISAVVSFLLYSLAGLGERLAAARGY